VLRLTGWIKRLVFSAAGGVAAAAFVALVEARAIAAGELGGHADELGTLVLADIGVLAPLAIAVSLAVGVLAVFLEPERARSPQEHIASLRTQPVLMRSRTAALAPLGILVAFGWCVASAQIARTTLAEGSAIGAGAQLAVLSLAALAALATAALAVLPTTRKLLASGAASHPSFLDPIVTGGVALAIVAVGLAWGIYAGDAGGDGPTALAIFGVLKRAELDLRPLVNVAAIAMAAYLVPVALADRAPPARVLGALVVSVLALGVTVREASALNEAPALARAVERGAPLGRIALQLDRRATDRDRDGTSPWFAGGDCDDRDPRRNPNAIEIPGNGIDEDCSGADLILAAPPPPPPETKKAPARGLAPALPPDLNLILITIDTLRIDVGFMGYPLPVTPNLDRLAERGVVFDRAYSMASYTGKSLGPLLIGKYPSETARDGGHFNAYYASNTLLAERLRAAGFHTMGAASHWYFVPWSGLTQGMDVWDHSAQPPSGQGDNDTSVTSAELSNAALRLLAKPENTEGRFFLWLHYFDPHEQYMPHEGAPSFLAPGATSYTAQQKAAYDAEVWFTDQHIGRVLDYVASQPWGARTAFVVTSDHGEAFSDHGMSWHGVEIWEPLVRVPFLVVVPGIAPHHVPVKRSQIDLVPTVLDILSVPQPPPGELSGRSMMADLVPGPESSDAGSSFEERDVLIDMPIGPHTGMRRALISGDTPGMKLIHFGGEQYELFDLASDPGEKTDLVLDRSKFAPMLQRFNAHRAQLREIAVPPAAPASP
jgi:arylsulfatase A-like enzyme